MDSKYISTRQKRLLKELLSREYISKEELMIKLSIKDRTLRKDIKLINEMGKDSIIANKKNKGYYIVCKKDVQEMIMDIDDVEENRLFVIVKNLVIYPEVDIYDLADKLFVSESTIEKDLKYLREYISKFVNLSLKRRKNLLFLVGDEQVRRSLLCEMMLDEATKNDFNIHIFKRSFHFIDIIKVEKMVSQMLDSYHIIIEDVSLMDIVLHISILLERKFLIQDKSNKSYIFQKDDNFLTDLLSCLEKEYKISFTSYEYKYLEKVMTIKIHNYENRINSYKNDILDEESEVIDNIICRIFDIYHVDFSDDIELKNDLKLHLLGLKERLKLNIVNHNVMLDEIKKSFPFIFEIGVDIACQYEKLTNIVIQESEIGFIVLHLVCAFERLNTKKELIKLLIVCPTGYSSSKILEIKLNNYFQNKIKIIGVSSVANISKINLKKIDFIVSTVPLNIQFKNIVICSPFLGQDDLNNLEEKFNNMKKRIFLKKKINLFEEDLFLLKEECMSKEEVIYLLYRKLHNKGYVDENYYDSVLEREKISSTSYAEGIAIPHPMSMNAKKTVAAVCVLQQPIMWGKFKVNLIILLCFKENDKKELFDFYERISAINIHDNAFSKIFRPKNYHEFINAINIL